MCGFSENGKWVEIMDSLANYLWIVFISMLPVVELRGAIPVALGLNINPIIAFLICISGNMLPVPFIMLFIRPILNYLKKRPKIAKHINRLEAKALNKSGKIQRYSFLGLAIFVGIPLPGTGAWTGALMASLLDMRLKKAIPSIFIGVVIAGIVVTLASTGAFAGVEIIKNIFFLK